MIVFTVFLANEKEQLFKNKMCTTLKMYQYWCKGHQQASRDNSINSKTNWDKLICGYDVKTHKTCNLFVNKNSVEC